MTDWVNSLALLGVLVVDLVADQGVGGIFNCFTLRRKAQLDDGVRALSISLNRRRARRLIFRRGPLFTPPCKAHWLLVYAVSGFLKLLTCLAYFGVCFALLVARKQDDIIMGLSLFILTILRVALGSVLSEFLGVEDARLSCHRLRRPFRLNVYLLHRLRFRAFLLNLKHVQGQSSNFVLRWGNLSMVLPFLLHFAFCGA